MRPGIVFYTDSRLDSAIAGLCRRQLLYAAGTVPIVTVALGQPAGFGEQYVLHAERGYITMTRQILLGLEQSKADYVFLCEHDVLYHPSHFEFVPAHLQTFYYNVNVYKAFWEERYAVWCDDTQQVSGVVAGRDVLVEFYRQKLAQVMAEGRHDRHFEPGLHQKVGSKLVENWQSRYANLDIRHGGNLTPSRRSPSAFRNPKYARGWRETETVDGWGRLADVLSVKVGE